MRIADKQEKEKQAILTFSQAHISHVELRSSLEHY